MDSDKCHVFLTVVAEAKLTKAAERLGYTVSGVSRSIAALEDECGFSLLYRERNGVRLTKEGEQLLPVFREYEQVSDRLMDSIHALKGLHAGKVSVGVVYVNHFRWVTQAIHAFQEDYPDIEISVVQGNSTELITALQEHRLDFVIASKREGAFQYRHVQQASMCTCVPADHELVQQGIYPLRRFETDRMIAPYSESETDYALALKANHISPNIVHVTSDVYSAYSMVEAGLGVAFLNRLEPECWDGNVVLLPTEPAVKIDIGIMYLDCGLGPSARKFMERICGERG